MFPNSFQPKLIPEPVSRVPPALSLEYVSQSPWNHCRVSLEWKLCQTPGVSGRKKMVLAERKEVFFQFSARSKCWHRLPCVWGQWHIQLEHFPKSLARRRLASGCRSHSYFSLPIPTFLNPFPPSWAQQTQFPPLYYYHDYPKWILLFCLHMHVDVKTLLPHINFVSCLHKHVFWGEWGLNINLRWLQSCTKQNLHFLG